MQEYICIKNTHGFGGNSHYVDFKIGDKCKLNISDDDDDLYNALSQALKSEYNVETPPIKLFIVMDKKPYSITVHDFKNSFITLEDYRNEKLNKILK